MTLVTLVTSDSWSQMTLVTLVTSDPWSQMTPGHLGHIRHLVTKTLVTLVTSDRWSHMTLVTLVTSDPWSQMTLVTSVISDPWSQRPWSPWSHQTIGHKWPWSPRSHQTLGHKDPGHLGHIRPLVTNDPGHLGHIRPLVTNDPGHLGHIRPLAQMILATYGTFGHKLPCPSSDFWLVTNGHGYIEPLANIWPMVTNDLDPIEPLVTNYPGLHRTMKRYWMGMVGISIRYLLKQIFARDQFIRLIKFVNGSKLEFPHVLRLQLPVKDQTNAARQDRPVERLVTDPGGVIRRHRL